MSFNKVIVVGNLGRDPELRYTPQGTAVCSFSVATSEKRRDKAGEFQEITTWFRVTLWGKQAEVASKYLVKGKPIYVEGRLRVEEYTDRDGKNRYALELNASDMQFIGSNQNEGSNSSYSNSDSENDFSSTNDFPANTGTSSTAAGGGVVTANNAPNDEDIPF